MPRKKNEMQKEGRHSCRVPTFLASFVRGGAFDFLRRKKKKRSGVILSGAALQAERRISLTTPLRELTPISTQQREYITSPLNDRLLLDRRIDELDAMRKL